LLDVAEFNTDYLVIVANDVYWLASVVYCKRHILYSRESVSHFLSEFIVDTKKANTQYFWGAPKDCLDLGTHLNYISALFWMRS